MRTSSRATTPRLEGGDLRHADPAVGVSLRAGRGGPAPARVEEQIEALRGIAAEVFSRTEEGAGPLVDGGRSRS